MLDVYLRDNPWRKTKRDQLQSWNILSFNPKTTDVDEHIDLINTLGDMVDQKEEAKKEKFIETMPTMIQTHLIMCKDWAMVKDTTKSLEHLIMKCNPPTPAMPMMATGATVPGLYSHIAHLVDKKRVKYLNCLKVQNQNKPEAEVNLKENLKNKDKTHQKLKKWMKLILMKVLTIITTMPQVRVEATDLTMVRAETNNLEGLYHKTEVKDLNIVSVNSRITATRKAHHKKIVHNMVAHISHIFRGTKCICIEAKDLNSLEDVATAGQTSRIMLDHISISITHMISNWNSMAHHAVCVEDLTIPPSIVIRENMTSITLWKR